MPSWRAGRAVPTRLAEATFAAADAQMGPLVAWYRHYARRVTAEAALADGWGEPAAWLREGAELLCRSRSRPRGGGLPGAAAPGRGAGPRRRPGSPGLPGQLRALGVTEREADVLRLAAQGLGNREIAEAMFLSPRTVEKHVASLLAKTGLRRAQLAGYASGLP